MQIWKHKSLTNSANFNQKIKMLKTLNFRYDTET